MTMCNSERKQIRLPKKDGSVKKKNKINFISGVFGAFVMIVIVLAILQTSAMMDVMNEIDMTISLTSEIADEHVVDIPVGYVLLIIFVYKLMLIHGIFKDDIKYAIKIIKWKLKR